MPFQIRATAAPRFANFLTGDAPGRLFQISTSRAVGQFAASFARAASFPKRSVLGTASASCLVVWIVMLLVSFSTVKIFMLWTPCAAAAAITTLITPIDETGKQNLLNSVGLFRWPE